MENPPPYSPSPERTGTIRAREPPPKPTVPAASVSQVHVFSRKEDIEGQSDIDAKRVFTEWGGLGTFHIDPRTPTLGDGPTIRTRYGKKKMRKGKNKGTADVPHASFQTRSGNMKLQLATTSSASVEGEKEEQAKIFVGSRSGKIEITLVSSVLYPSYPQTSDGLDA